jgi:microcystin-dependent protein
VSMPFLGEIMMFAGNFAPKGWAFCQGQTMLITENTALFSILGTTYGGNGTTNFQLPDFRGRFPLSQGQGSGLPSYALGEVGGSATAAISSNNLPGHTHAMPASTDLGTTDSPTNAVMAQGGSYAVPTDSATSAAPTGSNATSATPLPVQNAYLAVNFIIALAGVFPSRN